MILSILTSFVLVILNPLSQIRKGQDSQRQHDLRQLSTALDSYYNDNNYYPQVPSVLVTAKNIQTVPNDPAALVSWPNYAYVKAMECSFCENGFSVHSVFFLSVRANE
jgi:type II secretory pathway pseudopilin PulG